MSIEILLQNCHAILRRLDMPVLRAFPFSPKLAEDEQPETAFGHTGHLSHSLEPGHPEWDTPPPIRTRCRFSKSFSFRSADLMPCAENFDH